MLCCIVCRYYAAQGDSLEATQCNLGAVVLKCVINVFVLHLLLV